MGYAHGATRAPKLAQDARALETRVQSARTELAALERRRAAVQNLIGQEAEAKSQLLHNQREARRIKKETEAAQSAHEELTARLAALAAAEEAALKRRDKRTRTNGISDEAYAAYEWSMRHYPDNQFMAPRRRRALEAEVKAHEHYQEAA